MPRCPWFSLLLCILAGLGTAPRCAADGHAAPARPTLFEQTLPDGLRIICRSDTTTPLVSLQVFVKVGAAQENPNRSGVGSFVARTLLASTAGHVPESLQTEIGSLGGNVSTLWQPDYTLVSALTVKDQFRDAVSLLADVLQNADFDPTVVESTRQDILAEIANAGASVFQSDYNGIRESLYGGSAYTLPPIGTASSVSRITRADLQRFFNRYYVPQNMVFVVVGDVDPEAAEKEIATAFADFPTQGRGAGRASAASSPLPYPAASPAPVKVRIPDLAEVGVMVGYRVPGINDPDYPAVLVANALLGGMKTSRLFTNLRDKQGQAYETGSLINTQQDASDLTAYLFQATDRSPTSANQAVPATTLIKENIVKQIAGLRETPPTEADLSRAKHYLIGSYKIRHERLQDRATLLGVAALQARGGSKFDTEYAHYIESVTLADVSRVITKYLVHPAVSVVEPDTRSDAVVNR